MERKEGDSIPRYLDKQQLHHTIDQLRQEHAIPSPCDPWALAEQWGIQVQRRDLASPGLCGALIRVGSSATVVLSSASLLGSERFTLAHELGHYCLHRETGQFFCGEAQQESPLEWQANTFAAELLLPYRLLLPRLEKICLSGGGTVRTLHLLAEEFQVSPLMIRRRTDDLSFELWQLLHGVELERIQMVSHARQVQHHLPGGPSADQLFPTLAHCAQVDKEPV